MRNKFLIFGFIFTLLAAAFVSALSVTERPKSCTGGWNNCEGIFPDTFNFATANATNGNVTGIWADYNISLPQNITLKSVWVFPRFWFSQGTGVIEVKVSWDGGATFGPSHLVNGDTTERLYSVDLTKDTTWTIQKLSNSNLKVKVTCIQPKTCYLSDLAVSAYYI